eukprot:12235875-Alexandrium_andersonii.AAC.1
MTDKHSAGCDSLGRPSGQGSRLWGWAARGGDGAGLNAHMTPHGCTRQLPKTCLPASSPNIGRQLSGPRLSRRLPPRLSS